MFVLAGPAMDAVGWDRCAGDDGGIAVAVVVVVQCDAITMGTRPTTKLLVSRTQVIVVFGSCGDCVQVRFVTCLACRMHYIAQRSVVCV